MTTPVEDHPDSRPDRPVALLRVKAIPNARRPGIAGVVGDRLKVKVNAPAEDGKANRAVCDLIAAETGLRSGDVSVERGRSDPEKTLRLCGIGASAVRTRLGLPGTEG